MGHSEYDPVAKERRPWNAGRKLGAKRALKAQQVWAIPDGLANGSNRPEAEVSTARRLAVNNAKRKLCFDALRDCRAVGRAPAALSMYDGRPGDRYDRARVGWHLSDAGPLGRRTHSFATPRSRYDRAKKRKKARRHRLQQREQIPKYRRRYDRAIAQSSHL
jgi:hypothetical protein